MLRRIDRDIRKMHARRRVRNALPKAGKFAACLALVFYLGLGLAFAASPAVRVNLMKFFVNIEGRHASYGFEETGEFIEVPRTGPDIITPLTSPKGLRWPAPTGAGCILSEATAPCWTLKRWAPAAREVWIPKTRKSILSGSTGAGAAVGKGKMDLHTVERG